MEKIKDNLAAIWFVLTSIAVAVLVYIIKGKNEKISKLVYTNQIQKINQKLEKAKEKDHAASTTAKKSNDNYNTLRRRYGPLLKKYGLRATKNGVR